MKLKSNPFLAASLVTLAALIPMTVFAVTKANNADALNLPSSWTGGVAPDGTSTTSTGVAQFDTSIIGTGAASYTLGGNVTWGMIRVDRATATAGSLITITSANTITLNGNNSVATARQDAILLNSATGSPLQIDSNIILGAANGTTEYFTASRNLTLSGNVDLSGVNLNAFAAGGTSTYNGVLFNSEGTSGLTKSGNGALLLSNANTYNGATNVTAGTLTVSGITNGTSSVTVNGGSSLIVATGGTLTTAGVLGTAVATGANITVQTGATMNAASANIAWNPNIFQVDGVMALTGNFTVSTNASGTISGTNGSITAASFSMGNATTTVNFTNTGSMAFTGDMTLAANNSTFNQSAGTISANGILLNSGTSNTYSLSGGRINLGANGISSTSGTKVINLGAATVGARANWSSSLAMSLTHAATGTTFNTLDSVDNTTARGITLSGPLGGPGKLVKAGAGTLTLGGTNNYSGETAVNAGTLMINGNNAAATGTVTVASGATLGGTGMIGGAVNVTGTLAPGASIESLGTGALSFGATSTFAYELDSSALNGDLLGSTGTLDIAAGSILTLTELAFGTLSGNSKLTLISYTGGWVNTELFTYLGGTLNDGDIISLGSNQWQFDYNDITGGSNYNGDQSGATRFVTMTVVPEPRAALLGGLGVLCLLRRRRD